MESEFSDLGRCFVNVWNQVQRYGGKQVFGWIEGTVIFPEKRLVQPWYHHCAWESPDGSLFDITPQLIPNSGIVFPERVRFWEDDDALLMDLGNGWTHGLYPLYIPLVKSEEVMTAIGYLKAADVAAFTRQERDEEYWLQRASTAIGGTFEPTLFAGYSAFRYDQTEIQDFLDLLMKGGAK